MHIENIIIMDGLFSLSEANLQTVLHVLTTAQVTSSGEKQLVRPLVYPANKLCEADAHTTSVALRQLD